MEKGTQAHRTANAGLTLVSTAYRLASTADAGLPVYATVAAKNKGSTGDNQS